jgi:methyl-accepting chemotaxis protein
LRSSVDPIANGDTYLFAYDIDLNVLLNPAFPEREGRNLAGQHDANGHAVHDEIRAVVTTNHAGWIDAVIARPGSTVPARKRVYVVAVSMDGKPGILGSGFYPR